MTKDEQYEARATALTNKLIDVINDDKYQYDGNAGYCLFAVRGLLIDMLEQVDEPDVTREVTASLAIFALQHKAKDTAQ